MFLLNKFINNGVRIHSKCLSINQNILPSLDENNTEHNGGQKKGIQIHYKAKLGSYAHIFHIN